MADDEWIKGLFTHNEHAVDLDKPVAIEEPKDNYQLIEGEKAQEKTKSATAYIANKKLLKKGTAATEKIAKGDFCNLNTEVPHLSGYNIPDVMYVVPCNKPQIPQYKLR